MKRDFTRREFVTGGMLGLAAMALPKSIFAFERKPGVKQDSGLFFSKEDIPRIKENIELPMFKDLWDEKVNIDFDKQKEFIANVDLNRHWEHLNPLTKLLQDCALVTLLTDDKRHEEIAKLAIKKIQEFKEWDYFMVKETKEPIGLQMGPAATIAMTLAYDWMGEKLSAEEKENILNNIVEKGVPACYNSLYYMRNPEKSGLWVLIPSSPMKFEADTKRWPWFLNQTNLKIVPVSGLTFAAVLLHGKHPEAKKWLEMARWGVETVTKIYYKDGCYDEGVGYWDYSTRHIIMAVELLKRNLKIDYTKEMNFSGSIKFVLQMTAPFKDFKYATVNFSDAGFNPDASAGYWVAKEFKDGLAQYTAQEVIGRRNSFAFIYYDKNIKATAPKKSDMNVKMDIGWIVSRTGWTEEDSLLGFRGGNPGNHEHADRNSFIFQAHGDRLLHDPMGAAYRASEKHWVLRHTEAHNSILIDGKGHFFHDGREGTNMTTAKATTLKYEANDEVTIIVSDATQPYQLADKDVKRVVRTLYFFKPDIVILVDDVEKFKKSSKVQARFHPFNLDAKATVASVGDNEFVITRPYAKLFGKVLSKQKTTVKTAELDIPKGDIVFPNAQAKIEQVFPFVEVSTIEPASKNRLTTVLLAQKSSVEEIPEITMQEKKGGIDVAIKCQSGMKKYFIQLNKKYPVINKI